MNSAPPREGRGTPLREKETALKERLRGLGRVVVAFSGGVDSSLLADVAAEVIPDRCILVTALSESYPKAEMEKAVAFAGRHPVELRFVETHEFQNEAYRANPANRCYYCKSELFQRLNLVKEEMGFDAVADGCNADDLTDYRPGRQAAKELGVVSPLQEAGLTKDDIRALSRERELPTWDVPALACLSSRFPYGSEITREGLERVDRSETWLREAGFKVARVRHYGDLARVEVEPGQIARLCEPEMREAAFRALKEYGYKYVCVDLEGYRSGSMNEALTRAQRIAHIEILPVKP